MKLNEINEIGFYYQTDFPDRLYIYEVFENTDEEWLKENPNDKLLIDEWIFDHEDKDNIKHYGCGGNLISVPNAYDFEVTKIIDTKYVRENLYMQEDKLTYKEKYNKLTQALAEIKEIAESENTMSINKEGYQLIKQILAKIAEVENGN